MSPLTTIPSPPHPTKAALLPTSRIAQHSSISLGLISQGFVCSVISAAIPVQPACILTRPPHIHPPQHHLPKCTLGPIASRLDPTTSCQCSQDNPCSSLLQNSLWALLTFHFHLFYLCACSRCSNQSALTNLTASTQALGLCLAVLSAWSSLSPVSAGHLLPSTSDIPSQAFSPAQPESLPGVPLYIFLITT